MRPTSGMAPSETVRGSLVYACTDARTLEESGVCAMKPVLCFMLVYAIVGCSGTNTVVRVSSPEPQDKPQDKEAHRKHSEERPVDRPLDLEAKHLEEEAKRKAAEKERDEAEKKRKKAEEERQKAHDKRKKEIEEAKVAASPTFARHLRITSGLALTNPYTLTANPSDGTFTLVDNETEGNFYVEAAVRYRSAWMPPDDHFLAGSTPFAQAIVPADYDFRLGLVAIDDETRANVAPGASNVYGEISAGWPIYSFLGHRNKETGEFEQSDVGATINIEGLFGATTDKSSQDIHDYYGVGIGTAWRIGKPLTAQQFTDGKTLPPATAFFAVYYGAAEAPEFTDDRRTASVISERGYPEFRTESAFIMRTEFDIPLSKVSAITIGARLFLGFDEVNPWSLSVGYSLSLAQLAKLFGHT